MRLILTQTRTFQGRSEDVLRLLLELRRAGPADTAGLARRLGWERHRVESAGRDSSGEARRGEHGWELTAAGRLALE